MALLFLNLPGNQFVQTDAHLDYAAVINTIAFI